MTRPAKYSSDGFTLVEALIVVALTGVMMVVLTQFFFGGNQIYRTQNAELDINFYARMALDDIDAYVRQATRTLSSYDTYAAGSDVLILEIAAVNDSTQLIPGVSDHVVFYLSGDQLMRQIYADPASVRESGVRQLAADITSLVFTYDNADYSQVTAVDTDMVISQSAGRETRTLSAGSKSRLRN